MGESRTDQKPVAGVAGFETADTADTGQYLVKTYDYYMPLVYDYCLLHVTWHKPHFLSYFGLIFKMSLLTQFCMDSFEI